MMRCVSHRQTSLLGVIGTHAHTPSWPGHRAPPVPFSLAGRYFSRLTFATVFACRASMIALAWCSRVDLVQRAPNMSEALGTSRTDQLRHHFPRRYLRRPRAPLSVLPPHAQLGPT